MNAEQILVMQEGRIVERGSHPDLLAMNGHYARMWALQQQEQPAPSDYNESAIH